MKSPYTGKEMELKRTKSTLHFRKEPFEITYHSYVCSESHEEFEDDRLTTLNMQQVTDQYREKYNIPFPEQIRAIRKSYGLSAARMSEILGLGINTWRLYENGEVPTVANARLMQLISDPQNFIKHISEFGTCSQREIDKIRKNITEQQQKADEAHFFESLFRVSTPNRYSGYTTFSKTKTGQLTLYFAKELSPYKTAMNKLLFYADFLHFKNTGRSITGLKYAAIDFGPVPDHYSSMYEMLADENVIAINGTITDYGFAERLVPGNIEIDLSIFDESEINAMQQVIEKLGSKSTKEIVEQSHEEEAWFANQKALIPYSFAYSLKAV
jgi:putative zinc finger/helix-turn-helix YgiT family protein